MSISQWTQKRPLFSFSFSFNTFCAFAPHRARVARVLNLKIFGGFTAFPAIRTQIGSNLNQPPENLKN
jgi:hypothetical protein